MPTTERTKEPKLASASSTTLPPTPALERLIERVRSGVARLVWLHGLGTVSAAFAAVLLLAFVADWTLHLPAAVRWVQLLILCAVPVVFLVRELVRPLRLRPDRSGLAVLIERAHPELKELLVSAVELRAAAQPSGDPRLIEAVLLDAERAAQGLSLERVLEPRGPRLRFALGAATSALCALVLFTNADAARVFFARIAGGDTAWPQRTHLQIEIPIAASLPHGGTSAQPASEAQPATPPASSDAPPSTLRGELVVKVARGSDVPVVVRAQGVVPDEVTLHFAGGHKAVLAAAGGPTFRTLLRAVQEDLEFHVTGGDDEDEDPHVRLLVLQPPDVAGIAIEITPPAYSKLPARVEFDRDVEVLAGSALRVHMLPDPPQATGVVRLLPEDRVLALRAEPFPNATATETPQATPERAPSAQRSGLAFDLAAQKSLRLRFELQDAAGLTNPDPGLFGIAVIDDRAPEVEIQSPGRGDFDTVLGGLVSLRARAEDDFGIARMDWIAGPAGESDDTKLHKLELEWQTAPLASAAQEVHGGEQSANAGEARAAPKTPQSVRAAALARKRIEVSTLGGGEAVLEGQQFQLAVSALDNCEPNAHEGHSATLRVRVVSSEEFLRRMQDRLARIQGSVSALGELQREKHRRTLELLSSLESDELLPDGAAAELAAAVTGERRVQGDARAIARELSSLVEAVLYARIDERAGALLEFIDTRLAQAVERGFDPAPWRELSAAYRQGTLGATGLSGKLIDIAGLSFEISEDHATSATEALARAQDTIDLKKIHAELESATDNQGKALLKIERLLELLAEWDNFQSVLSLTRDILNGQKSLSERTRQFAKDH